MTETVRVAHPAMGSEFGIAIRGEEERFARQAARAAFAVLESIEDELSPRRPASDASRIAVLKPGRWCPIGLECARCLAEALEARRLTAGAFDVTRGRWRDLVLDARRHRVRVRRAGVRFDPGGIGKGYALDRMADCLREWGVNSAFLHGGGSTALVLGEPPSGGWLIALSDPRRPARSAVRLRLVSGAVSGSGVAALGPHITDPRTGGAALRPAAWSWAATGALADALSTAFMVLRPSEIRRVCARGRAAAIIAADGPGPLRLARIGTSGGWVVDKTGTGGR